MSSFRKNKQRAHSKQRMSTRTPEHIYLEESNRSKLSRHQLPSPKLSFSSASSYDITKAIVSRQDIKLIKIRKIYSTSSPDKMPKISRKRNKLEFPKEAQFPPIFPSLKPSSSQYTDPRKSIPDNASLILIQEYPENRTSKTISFKKAIKNKK